MKIIQNIDAYGEEIRMYMEHGNPIVVPTDTNYNLACLPESIEAIDKIYTFKERKRDKPLSLFFLHKEDWKKYGYVENKEFMNILIEKYWPGPLNIVVSKKSKKFDYMLNGSESIALGCIRNKAWRKLLECLGKSAIALTSANISGTVLDEIVTKEVVLEQMGEKIAYMIESEEPIEATKSSTIVSIEQYGVQILRDGDISQEELKEVLIREGFYVHKEV